MIAKKAAAHRCSSYRQTGYFKVTSSSVYRKSYKLRQIPGMLLSHLKSVNINTDKGIKYPVQRMPAAVFYHLIINTAYRLQIISPEKIH